MRWNVSSGARVMRIREHPMRGVRDYARARGATTARPRTARGRCPASSFCFQAEDGIRDLTVTGVQTCALPIKVLGRFHSRPPFARHGRDSSLPRQRQSHSSHSWLLAYRRPRRMKCQGWARDAGCNRKLLIVSSLRTPRDGPEGCVAWPCYCRGQKLPDTSETTWLTTGGCPSN